MRILNKTPKTHNARHGKGGFTLVELCVVLALLAILAVGITSFSVLMNGFAADASEETAFWEENAALKERIIKLETLTANLEKMLILAVNTQLGEKEP